MGTWCPHIEIQRLEKAVTDKRLSFSAAYMAVRSLEAMITDHPAAVSLQTPKSLEALLKSTRYTRQSQALAFYREAAHAVAAVLLKTRDRHVLASCIFMLKNIAAGRTGAPQRAAAEALGNLPIAVQGPALQQETLAEIPTVPFSDICRRASIHQDRPRVLGRSIVWPVKGQNHVFVIKQAENPSALQGLHQEALWMAYLSQADPGFRNTWHVPRPLRFHDSYVFKPARIPKGLRSRISPSTGAGAMAYMAHSTYFSYPNAPANAGSLDSAAFNAVMTANARILGYLTRMGIVHTAPIPLFHNRTQRLRRRDNGIYEWPRGGRLDRWLHSCQFPNLGVSGIRDFEHMIPVSGPDPRLYRHIGTHLLGMVLVMGSYFRNKDPDRLGLDDSGRPQDVRDLFDQTLFRRMIEDTFRAYYRGFVGRRFTAEMPVDMHRLTSRLTEEMGCDRHMVEILRTADQQAMSVQEFRDFLHQRGYTPEEAWACQKGDKDITIRSGPHLGDFNGRISVPELTTFLSNASAFCIADKYVSDRWADVSKTSTVQPC